MPPETTEVPVRIDHLGAQGDGVGMLDGKPVYVGGALAGEVVTVQGKGAKKQVFEIISKSAERVDAFCQYFGQCGGCQVQHLADDAYVAWKTGLLREAFSREGIAVPFNDMLRFQQANRRRAVLTARPCNERAVLGFSERSSHAIVDIDQCPILVPELNNALPAIRDLLTVFGAVKGDVRVNILAVENGIDLAFNFSGKAPSGIVRALTTHRMAAHFLRLSLNDEVVLERQRPRLSVGIASVCPPPGAFVQASGMAENAMADLVIGHLETCKRVADLFCGFGAFGLRLARHSMVHACESDSAALVAMDEAWRQTGGRLKALTHEKRDLFRRPLMEKELRKTDGVVFDPPRAGAEAQAGELAKSAVKKIAAVSCNPVTLARDTRLLVDGGYRIISVTPIDQFAFTPHLETVVLLER